MNNKPSIRDYILANPGASTREVMKATGAQRDSVNTLFTVLRRKYRNAPVNSAGVMQPEGLPAFTPEMFEQLTSKRPSVRFKHKKRVVMVKKEKKPVDLTKQPVEMPKPRASTPLTNDQIINIWTHMSGKAEGLSEAGVSVSFPILLVRAIEQWHGISS